MFRLLRMMILLVFIVAMVVGAYFWVARIPTVERFLSQKLNTEVTIDDIQLGLNQIKISGLKLKNLAPSSLPLAFQGDKITIDVDFFEIFKKSAHIKEIKIENPTLFIEFYNYTGSNNNWARLLVPHEHTFHEKHTFVIDKLLMTHVQFKAVRASGKEINIASIPTLELENLGANQELVFSQISPILFKAVLSTLASKPLFVALLNSITAAPEEFLKKGPSAHPFDETKKVLYDGYNALRKKATQFFHEVFPNSLHFNRSKHKILHSWSGLAQW